MPNIINTVKNYLEKQKKAIDSIDNKKQIDNRKKQFGLPAIQKPSTISKDIEESDKLIKEMRRKGWISEK